MIYIQFILLSLTITSSAMIPGDLDIQSFEEVWSIVNEKHWDLEGTGVNWDEVHKRYLPQIQKAETRQEWRKIIEKMIGELGQTHFGLLQSEHFESLSQLEVKLVKGYGVPDFKVEIVEGRIMVVGARDLNDPSSLPIGTQVTEVRDVAAKDIISALNKAYHGTPQEALYTTRILQSFFSGIPGQGLPLEIVPIHQSQSETKLAPLVVPAGVSQKLGDLPAMTFHFDQKKLDGDVGLVSFNIFLFPLMKQFPAALAHFSDCSGLIIDLRGNGGGIGFLASNMAGYLCSEKGKLGTMYSKDSEINFPVLPRANNWNKPVAILIDGGSASTSEIFAAGIQDLKRGRIFGTQSAGAALPSFIEPLPNGDLFQFAFASYLSVKGRYLEGNGVNPDEKTPHTYAMLRQEKDASIEAAIKWIKSQSNGEKK